MSVEIHCGGADDLDPVMEVMRSAFSDLYGEAWTRSQCAGILPMQGVKLTLARDAGSVVGFALHRVVTDDAELLLLAVDPGRQRQGVGQRLLQYFIEDAKKNGATKIHLEVRDGNHAVRFYEAAGFVPSHRRRNYYHGQNGKRYDALTFLLSTNV